MHTKLDLVWFFVYFIYFFKRKENKLTLVASANKCFTCHLYCPEPWNGKSHVRVRYELTVSKNLIKLHIFVFIPSLAYLFFSVNCGSYPTTSTVGLHKRFPGNENLVQGGLKLKTISLPFSNLISNTVFLGGCFLYGKAEDFKNKLYPK